MLKLIRLKQKTTEKRDQGQDLRDEMSDKVRIEMKETDMTKEETIVEIKIDIGMKEKEDTDVEATAKTVLTPIMKSKDKMKVKGTETEEADQEKEIVREEAGEGAEAHQEKDIVILGEVIIVEKEEHEDMVVTPDQDHSLQEEIVIIQDHHIGIIRVREIINEAAMKDIRSQDQDLALLKTEHKNHHPK